jgi:hypothetical protein
MRRTRFWIVAWLLVVWPLAGVLGITTPTAPTLASDVGVLADGDRGLGDQRPVSGLVGLPSPGPLWAIESDVLVHDHHGADDQLSTAPAAGSAMMPEMISGGEYHTCGLRTDGTLACWGRDDDGQSTPPTHAAGGFAQVSAGGFHICGLKTDGTLACWGRDNYGQSAPPGSGLISLPSS